MKKILLATGLVALTSTGFAAGGMDLKPYIEGSIGYGTSDNLNIETTAAHISPNDTAIYGIELGIKNIAGTNFRLGLSDDYTHASSKIHQGDGTTQNGSRSSNNRYMINGYYDFKLNDSITPYLGAGLGFYDAQGTNSNEFIWSLIGGAKYNINPNLYVGLKGKYIRASGSSFTDNSGTKYNLSDSNGYGVLFNLGYEF